jgi:phosphoribosyl 1,2-cyclic phosphodiesterase
VKVKFWGTRGSIATPGQDTVRYGGNTSCVEVSDDKNLVIFDAGTGIRLLGLDLLKRANNGGIRGHIFISHFHLDHIQGFPFFVPVYIKGNAFTIYGCEGAGKKLESIFVGQMSPEYFPVTLTEMPAELNFVQLTTRPVQVNGWTVNPTYVNHPGLALGYRVDAGATKVAYVTDNEPFRYLLRAQGNLKPVFDDIDQGQVTLEREDKHLAEAQLGPQLFRICRRAGDRSGRQAPGLFSPRSAAARQRAGCDFKKIPRLGCPTQKRIGDRRRLGRNGNPSTVVYARHFNRPTL